MLSKRNKMLIAVITISLLMISLIGCAKQSSESQKTPIKIGFFAPITGPAAADGQSVLNAAKLAVENINKQGGINGRPIELVYYDDQLDSKQAVSIAQKLTTKDGVVAVVSGSYSGPTRAVAPIFEKAKIPMISAYGVHPDITKGGDYVFRQSFLGPIQGKAGAYVAVNLLKAKKIAVLHMDNDFGTSLAEAFKQKAEELGATITSVNPFAMGEKEFTPLLTKIKQEKPDAIYFAAYAGEGAQIVRQAKALNIKAQLIGTEGVDSTTQFLQVAGKDAEGLIITTNLDRDSDRQVVKDFLSQYKEKFGFAPDMVAASTYDAFMVLAYVMKTYGTNPDQIKDGMYKVKDFEGVTGIIKGYNKLGEVTKAVQVQIVKNGEFHRYGVIDDPSIITPPEQ